MTDLSIHRFGLVTPLGFNAPTTLAALRAGISAIQQLNWMDRESGQPLNGTMVQLPQWWEGIGKLADLVAPAIHESLLILSPGKAAATPILLGVSSAQRPGRFEGLDERLLP